MRATSKSEPAWLAAARRHLGTSEVAGRQSSPAITGFFRRVVGQAMSDETPWCAAFVGACLLEAGLPSTGKLAARSYLKYGQSLAEPRPGAIAVFWRGSQSGWHGHVAFFLREVDGAIEVLGGNQSDAVTVARYPASRLLGYRWPGDAPLPEADAREPDLEIVQRRLRELGYREVGAIDGVWGTKTRGALLAFKADNRLPLDESLGPETIEALFVRATPRTVAPARQTAGVDDLRRQGSRTIAASDALKVAGGATVAVGTLGGAAEESGFLDRLRDAAGQAGELVAPFRALWSMLAGNWWLAALVIGGIVVWQAVRIARARLDDHRSGKTA